MASLKSEMVPPRRFIDPLSNDLMVDPVVLSDGRTVDRATATLLETGQWTRKPVRVLVDNVDLRRDLFEQYPEQGRAYEEAKACERKKVAPTPTLPKSETADLPTGSRACSPEIPRAKTYYLNGRPLTSESAKDIVSKWLDDLVKKEPNKAERLRWRVEDTFYYCSRALARKGPPSNADKQLRERRRERKREIAIYERWLGVRRDPQHPMVIQARTRLSNLKALDEMDRLMSAVKKSPGYRQVLKALDRLEGGSSENGT